MKSKNIILSAITILTLVACRAHTAEPPDPKNWFIQSFSKNILTARHSGHTYRAKCDGSRIWEDNQPANAFASRNCRFAYELIGRNVLAGENAKADTSGWIVQMTESDKWLMLDRLNYDLGKGEVDQFEIVATDRDGPQ